MFRKPAPAVSTRSMRGSGGSAAMSAAASSRGLRFSAFASCIATLLEKSPCSGCRGRSSTTLIVEPCGATDVTAWLSQACNSDLMSFKEGDAQRVRAGDYSVRAARISSAASCEVEGIDIEHPARAAADLLQLRTPLREQGLQRLAVAALHEHLCALHA